MATEKQIENTILEMAGKPSSGIIKELAPKWARAIAELDKIQAQDKKETRVTDSSEIR